MLCYDKFIVKRRDYREAWRFLFEERLAWGWNGGLMGFDSGGFAGNFTSRGYVLIK